MKDNFKCIVYIFCQTENGLPKLRFDIVTHVNYAFAIPTKDGHVLPLENPELARAVTAKAHAEGAKVCLSLGGWSYEDVPLEATFREGTDTPEKIASMAEEIAEMALAFGFDGVDVDWEYPRTGDGSKEQYEALISLLHAKLKPRGMLLTAAVLGGVDPEGEPIRSAAEAQDRPSFDKLDWLNIMAYDSGAPVHSPYEFAENCVKYWVEDRGFPPEKLNLGLPFYGRPFPGDYRDLLAADGEALEKDMVVMDGREVWYNGRDTLRRKVALAKEKGLGGVMVWEISEDCDDRGKSLLTVLGRAIAEG
ncbi:MAG: glycoside hydrolase family 18 protein [Oscillospiraceae bacterium]|nr:glycoside hydrolase family 18 protein [Oscillospiraceae bacterium]